MSHFYILIFKNAPWHSDVAMVFWGPIWGWSHRCHCAAWAIFHPPRPVHWNIEGQNKICFLPNGKVNKSSAKVEFEWWLYLKKQQHLKWPPLSFKIKICNWTFNLWHNISVVMISFSFHKKEKDDSISCISNDNKDWWEKASIALKKQPVKRNPHKCSVKQEN